MPFFLGRICRRKVKNLFKFVRSSFVLWHLGFAAAGNKLNVPQSGEVTTVGG